MLESCIFKATSTRTGAVLMIEARLAAKRADSVFLVPRLAAYVDSCLKLFDLPSVSTPGWADIKLHESGLEHVMTIETTRWQKTS